MEPHVPNRGSREEENITSGPTTIAHTLRSASEIDFALEHKTSARKKSPKVTGWFHAVRQRVIVDLMNLLVYGYTPWVGKTSTSNGKRSKRSIEPRVENF